MRLMSVMGAIVMCATSAYGGVLTFDLTATTLSVLPGGTIEFTGTLTNTEANTVYLNGDVAILLYTGLSLDDSPFFSNSPLFLLSGASYVGPFFDVTADAAAIPGSYTGSYTIQGGLDANTFDNVATRGFTVNVAGVPEPKSYHLLMAGLLIIAGIRSMFYPNIRLTPRRSSRGA